mgnify:CR=1 FL=1
MAVTYQTEGIKMPEIKKRETTEWIKAVAASYGKRLGEIAYIFCSDEKILEVNRQYLQHDYYTDIITFDYCEGDRLSGDLFISLDTVRTNAEQFGASYDNELHRVIIHGILHLCGINDKGPGEREIMEAAENFAKEQGYHKITLGAQVTAVGFYERLGYQKTGAPFMDAGIEHYEMNKEL